ncbi:MAG TPA: hypothetical protein VIU87_19110 [Mycobacterium sp.]
MAVPAWVTTGITTINGLSAITAPTNAEQDAYASIRAYMAANSGAWPSDATTRIQNALLANDVARTERYVRSQLLAELLRIQAAG